MKINKVHCLFEQTGTLIKQAKSLFFVVENTQKVYNVHITKKGGRR